jgi:hypothetical protein
MPTQRLHLLVAVCLLCAAGARATTFPSDSTASLVLQSERVCCASCESVEARVDPRSGLVFTHVRLRLLEDLKGSGTGDSVELRIVGGEANGIRTVVAGMPRFKPGRESVLMLGRKNRLGYRVLVSASRGVLPLKADKRGVRRLTGRLSGFGELSGKSGVRLDEFRAEVRRILAEAERRQAEREGSK